MKKIVFFVLFITLSMTGVFAQRVDITRTRPMEGWVFTEAVTLNARFFFTWDYAQSWNEQSGYALVDDRRLFFWLYDSMSYHAGKADVIYNRILPGWVEKLGYVIDYDSEVINNNINIASSIRTLMRQRGCDISVTITTGPIGPRQYDIDHLLIIEFFPSKGTYKATTYDLRRYYNLGR